MRVGRYHGEEFAVGVEGDVVGIAEAAGEEFPLRAVGVGAIDAAVGGLDFVEESGDGVLQPRKEVVLAPIAIRGVGREAVEDAGAVAIDDVELFVGPEDDGVRAVLARAAGDGLEKRGGVEVAVALRGFAAVDAAPLRPHAGDVEGVERPEHAHGVADWHLHALPFHLGGSAQCPVLSAQCSVFDSWRQLSPTEN
jgi:hypothetical protein